MKSNAGRKTIDEEVLEVNITIRFSKKEIEEIEEIAKNIDMPKTRFIRNLVLSSLGEAKFLNKIGALKGAKKLIDFKEIFTNTKKYPNLQTT